MAAQSHRLARHAQPHERGFTFLEILIVIAIASVVAAIAIPGYLAMMRYLRIAGDSRDLNAAIAQAKMRAAQDYTHARVHADLASNTFSMEYWNNPGDNTSGCWVTEGDPVLVSGKPRCTPTTGAIAQPLSQGVTFGTAGTGSGGKNPFTSIQQAPACTSAVAGGAAGSTYSNTACIEFNSRGIPVASDNSPALSDALYVTDSTTVYGVTVISSGLIQIWTADASASNWQAR